MVTTTVTAGRDAKVTVNAGEEKPAKKSKKARKLLKEKKEALEVALVLETDAARKLKIQNDLDDTLKMLTN